MRTIKFRAWLKSENKMLVVEQIYFDGYDGFEITSGDYESLDSLEVELMQFTGLLDKNGKEIYEGDILKISQGSKSAVESRYEIIFEFGAFQMKRYPEPENDYQNTAFITYAVQCSKYLFGIQDIETVQGYLEVIGNIYENPELLK